MTCFLPQTECKCHLIPNTFEDDVQNVYIIVCQNKLLTCSEFSWLLCLLSSQSLYMADVAVLPTSHTNIIYFSVLLLCCNLPMSYNLTSQSSMTTMELSAYILTCLCYPQHIMLSCIVV